MGLSTLSTPNYDCHVMSACCTSICLPIVVAVDQYFIEALLEQKSLPYPPRSTTLHLNINNNANKLAMLSSACPCLLPIVDTTMVVRSYTPYEKLEARG